MHISAQGSRALHACVHILIPASKGFRCPRSCVLCSVCPVRLPLTSRAFAAAAAIESRLAIQKGVLLDLSEQQIVSGAERKRGWRQQQVLRQVGQTVGSGSSPSLCIPALPCRARVAHPTLAAVGASFPAPQTSCAPCTCYTSIRTGVRPLLPQQVAQEECLLCFLLCLLRLLVPAASPAQHALLYCPYVPCCADMPCRTMPRCALPCCLPCADQRMPPDQLRVQGLHLLNGEGEPGWVAWVGVVGAYGWEG